MAQQQPRRVLRVAPPGRGGARAEAEGEAVFPTVQAAVDAVPLGNAVRTVIRLAPGVYREPVYVAKTRNLVTLAGTSPESTVITWDNTATRIKHAQSSRVIGTGTFGCGTVIVEGEDFIAENVTFENSAPQGSGQAVALRVTADRCAFYNCRFLGWQDTLYLHYGKQYLRDCYIEGNCDFIFGNSIALLEHCHIHCKSVGYITAHSRKSSSETTGYVFLRCIITGNGDAGYMFLGRPWGPFGRVVFAHTFMDRCIKPAGWHNWDRSENERTACFFEYRCSGPGSRPSNRVSWCRQLLDVEVENFLAHTFIDPDLDRPWLLQMMAIKIPASA
ncbi:pectinesterase 31 [Oryza brachyantha]|uniref:pectinesterase 31 n=1 Tax=Oryza brachyantha TaxID=4533 RepID=UPI001AD95384|nr:pectinesterase 31 [Oryza brachyantha]